MSIKLKEKYIEHCNKEKTIPISSQYWWLDSLCSNSDWDVIIIEENEDIIGSLPFFVTKQGPFRVQTMPTLTPNLGVWIKSSEEIKYFDRIDYENRILQQVISKLPSVDFVNVNMHYSMKNCLPFYWNGFQESARYTYIVEDLDDLDNVFNRFDPKMRNKVRKANKQVETISTEDIEAFFKINKMTFDRQGMKIPYSFQTILNHDKVLKEHKAREIFFAVDQNERVHSALYLTWDNMSSYVHMVGENPELRASGAGIKLIWDAIQFTRNELKLNKLDFEGSMIESVERVRRNCGGVQYTYSNLKKSKPLYAFVDGIRNITRRST